MIGAHCTFVLIGLEVYRPLFEYLLYGIEKINGKFIIWRLLGEPHLARLYGLPEIKYCAILLLSCILYTPVGAEWLLDLRQSLGGK